jgi:hypothetical protein
MIPFPLLFSFASNSGNLGGSTHRRGNLYREVWVSERIFFIFFHILHEIHPKLQSL